ncbi:MAG: PKD domain-containing protein, partial [Candidatus Lokiarchaeota archaeon]|nr:PKD domain-containing protein [Candidatus Lokiarchaeota archaeon]
TAAVTLAATWTGTEQGTGNPLSGDTPADTINVNIQARASVTITNMAITMPRPAPGPYIGGEMLSLSVTFFNAGGTAATVDSTLDDGPYTGLVFGFDPAAVVVASNTTYTQVFGVEILPGAQTATVTITATWAGTEAVTGREISGGPDTLLVDIKAQAVLTIPGSPLYMTGNGTYVAGTTFVVRVLLNNPATSAKAQAVTVALAGLVAGVTANASASKTVSGTTSIDFVITIAAGTASQALSLTATASGSEEITGRSLGAGPSSAMSITIKAQATLEITGFTWMTGNGTYVAGTTFVVRVSLSNPSTSAKAHSVTAPLSFGGATGLSANISVSKTISGAGYIDLSITIAAGAPGQPSVTVTTTVTGTEEISGRALGPLVTVLNITIEAASTLEITSLAITTPRAAPGPYVAGESFTLRVTFSNTGALAVTVDASIDAGVYTGLSWNNPAAVVVAAGGTSMQDFTVNVAAGADTAAVTLAATWNGTEDGTGNPLSGGSPSLLVNILAQAELAITGAPTFQTGNGTYVAGTTLVLRVAINNPAASARAQGVTAALVGLVAGVTANSSASRTVSGASHIDFLITIAAGVASQALSISAIVSGNEEYTGRALVAGPSPALNINIKAQSSLNIINVVDMTGAAPYWHGESFVVRVSYQNAGGTDVQGVDGVLGFNGYPFLSSSNPPAITVSAGSTTYQDFTITVGWVATAAMVEIGATVAGQEGITGRTLSDATNASTVLQLQVNGTWDISISITLTIHLDQVGVGQEVVWAAIITYQNLTVVQYAWDFGDGTVSAEPSPSHAYVEPGAYLVTLIVTFDNGLNVTAMMAIIAVKNQDMTYIYVLIIILAVGSVAVALGFSYKRVAIKREGTKWPGGKPSKHAHSSRYVDSAAIEQEDPRTGTVAPALPDATGGEHLEPETGPLGTPARAPGLDRRARVMAPDVVEFINKLDVPEDVKGEILGEIKAMPPEEQRVYLASIFVKEWETGDG